MINKGSENEKRQPKRWLFFDYIRALGIILVIFIHGIVYHYGLLAEINLDDLNIFFMITYLLLNWAGSFGLISAIVNTYSSYLRLNNNIENNLSYSSWRAFGRRWIFLGFFFLILNFVYNFLVGPFIFDLETRDPLHSFLPGVIRTGEVYSVAAEKILHGSVFAMLGWNLILMGIFFTFLFWNKEKIANKSKRIVVLVIGLIIILISFLRIYLYDDFTIAVENGNYVAAFFIDSLAGSYFPILPYLGFGMLGAYFGLVLAENPSKKKLLRLIWIGVSLLIVAVIAFMIPDSVYDSVGLLDDIFFSYITVIFEIGFFIILGIPLLLLFYNRRVDDLNLINKEKKKFSTIFLRFSTNSLTFFFLERTIAELFAKLLDVTIPGWNNYIWTSILFGLFLVLFWLLIAFIWNFAEFRFSFEWLLLKFFKLSRYQTDKRY